MKRAATEQSDASATRRTAKGRAEPEVMLSVRIPQKVMWALQDAVTAHKRAGAGPRTQGAIVAHAIWEWVERNKV